MATLQPVLFPLFVIWLLGLLMVLFRRGLGATYKISAILIFVFYALWFMEPILISLGLYLESLNTTLPAVFGVLKNLVALGLLFLWPVVLFAVFRTSGVDQAANLLRTMVILTLLFWLFWMLNYFLAPWPEETLRSLLPETLKIPEIPDPPVKAE